MPDGWSKTSVEADELPLSVTVPEPASKPAAVTLTVRCPDGTLLMLKLPKVLVVAVSEVPATETVAPAIAAPVTAFLTTPVSVPNGAFNGMAITECGPGLYTWVLAPVVKPG